MSDCVQPTPQEVFARLDAAREFEATVIANARRLTTDAVHLCEVEYRYTGGTHWCPLGPAERMKPYFDGVYRLKAGAFPTWQGDTPTAADAVGLTDPAIQTWPERIYLQCENEHGDGVEPFGQGMEVTWCQDQISRFDVEYVRADLVARPATSAALAHERWCRGVDSDAAKERIGELEAEIKKQMPRIRHLEHERDLARSALVDANEQLAARKPAAPTDWPEFVRRAKLIYNEGDEGMQALDYLLALVDTSIIAADLAKAAAPGIPAQAGVPDALNVWERAAQARMDVIDALHAKGMTAEQIADDMTFSADQVRVILSRDRSKDWKWPIATSAPPVAVAGVPDGLIEALNEAADVLLNKRIERGPLADELYGFAVMLRIAAAPSKPADGGEGAGDLWQPIETAPKDGRTMLLGRANEMGNWRTMRGQWFSQLTIDDEWEEPDGFEVGWYETAVADDVPNCWAIAPTHWQPLPARPAANGAGGQND